MLADDAYGWFEEHGGPTRANGDRFRQMVLSRGSTEDLAKTYADWCGRGPNTDAMKKNRGLDPHKPASLRADDFGSEGQQERHRPLGACLPRTDIETDNRESRL